MAFILERLEATKSIVQILYSRTPIPLIARCASRSSVWSGSSHLHSRRPVTRGIRWEICRRQSGSMTVPDPHRGTGIIHGSAPMTVVHNQVYRTPKVFRTCPAVYSVLCPKTPRLSILSTWSALSTLEAPARVSTMLLTLEALGTGVVNSALILTPSNCDHLNGSKFVRGGSQYNAGHTVYLKGELVT